MTTEEEVEESEFSSNDSEASFRTSMKAIRTHVCGVFKNETPVQNKFDAIAEQHTEDVAECMEALNGWAHKVVHKPRKVEKKLKQKKPDILISCEDDFDAALAGDAELAAKMPAETSRAKWMTMMSKCPPADQLQPGEIWGLVDSGSGVDGADLSVVCPDLVVEDAPNKINCTTANGGEMVASKVAYVKVQLDGQECDIPLSDLPLQMPIISARQHVGPRKHSYRIREGGGYFRNLQTRAKSRFIEHEGVYFIRLKVIGNSSVDKGRLFSRQGIIR